jgi:hypothetical protein
LVEKQPSCVTSQLQSQLKKTGLDVWDKAGSNPAQPIQTKGFDAFENGV